jgi:putative spermidine/putrescine transport system permease protein
MTSPLVQRAAGIQSARKTGVAADRPRRAWRGVPTWALLLPALGYLAVVFLVPLLNTLWTSLSDPTIGLQNYALILTEPMYRKVYLRTILVAATVAVLCLLLGYPLAHYMARKGGLVAAALLTVSGLCFWVSFLVRTYAWTVILGHKGPLTMIAELLGIDPPPVLLFTTTASLIAMTHILLPYMVLTLYVALARIDPTLIRAAHGLGASRFQTFVRVILPQSMPAVISGLLLVFVFCIGFYVTPTLLGSPHDMMISSVIANEIETLLDFGTASALSMVLLGVVVALLLIYDRIVGLDRLVR